MSEILWLWVERSAEASVHFLSYKCIILVLLRPANSSHSVTAAPNTSSSKLSDVQYSSGNLLSLLVQYLHGNWYCTVFDRHARRATPRAHAAVLARRSLAIVCPHGSNERIARSAPHHMPPPSPSTFYPRCVDHPSPSLLYCGNYTLAGVTVHPRNWARISPHLCRGIRAS